MIGFCGMSREQAATRSNCFPPVTIIGGSKRKGRQNKGPCPLAMPSLLAACSRAMREPSHETFSSAIISRRAWQSIEIPPALRKPQVIGYRVGGHQQRGTNGDEQSSQRRRDFVGRASLFVQFYQSRFSRVCSFLTHVALNAPSSYRSQQAAPAVASAVRRRCKICKASDVGVGPRRRVVLLV